MTVKLQSNDRASNNREGFGGPRGLKIHQRAKGLEPSPEAWKAAVLPLHYARTVELYRISRRKGTVKFFQTSTAGAGLFVAFLGLFRLNRVHAARRFPVIDLENVMIGFSHTGNNRHADTDVKIL